MGFRTESSWGVSVLPKVTLIICEWADSELLAPDRPGAGAQMCCA